MVLVFSNFNYDGKQIPEIVPDNQLLLYQVPVPASEPVLETAANNLLLELLLLFRVGPPVSRFFRTVMQVRGRPSGRTTTLRGDFKFNRYVYDAIATCACVSTAVYVQV